MLDWRHWLKREVAVPSILLILTGAGMIWLAVQLMPLLTDPDMRWLLIVFLSCVAVYALFAYVTMRHVLTTYTLERFDPGDPASVQRLSAMSRFNYPASTLEAEQAKSALALALLRDGFSSEAEHPVAGSVFIRTVPPVIPLLFKSRRERIFIVNKQPLNIFIVDFTIRDTLRYLEGQNHEPSDHNLLVFISLEPDRLEAASAAAGVVNFLGKTQEGTVGVLLLDAHHHRLYFPIDLTLLPFSQRRHLARVKRRILHAVRTPDQPPVKAGPAGGRRT
jgi:hypothetical protein